MSLLSLMNAGRADPPPQPAVAPQAPNPPGLSLSAVMNMDDLKLAQELAEKQSSMKQGTFENPYEAESRGMDANRQKEVEAAKKAVEDAILSKQPEKNDANRGRDESSDRNDRRDRSDRGSHDRYDRRGRDSGRDAGRDRDRSYYDRGRDRDRDRHQDRDYDRTSSRRENDYDSEHKDRYQSSGGKDRYNHSQDASTRGRASGRDFESRDNGRTDDRSSNYESSVCHKWDHDRHDDRWNDRDKNRSSHRSDNERSREDEAAILRKKEEEQAAAERQRQLQEQEALMRKKKDEEMQAAMMARVAAFVSQKETERDNDREREKEKERQREQTRQEELERERDRQQKQQREQEFQRERERQRERKGEWERTREAELRSKQNTRRDTGYSKGHRDQNFVRDGAYGSHQSADRNVERRADHDRGDRAGNESDRARTTYHDRNERRDECTASEEQPRKVHYGTARPPDLDRGYSRDNRRNGYASSPQPGASDKYESDNSRDAKDGQDRDGVQGDSTRRHERYGAHSYDSGGLSERPEHDRGYRRGNTSSLGSRSHPAGDLEDRHDSVDSRDQRRDEPKKERHPEHDVSYRGHSGRDHVIGSRISATEQRGGRGTTSSRNGDLRSAVPAHESRGSGLGRMPIGARRTHANPYLSEDCNHAGDASEAMRSPARSSRQCTSARDDVGSSYINETSASGGRSSGGGRYATQQTSDRPDSYEDRDSRLGRHAKYETDGRHIRDKTPIGAAPRAYGHRNDFDRPRSRSRQDSYQDSDRRQDSHSGRTSTYAAPAAQRTPIGARRPTNDLDSSSMHAYAGRDAGAHNGSGREEDCSRRHSYSHRSKPQNNGYDWKHDAHQTGRVQHEDDSRYRSRTPEKRSRGYTPQDSHHVQRGPIGARPVIRQQEDRYRSESDRRDQRW